VAQRAEELGDKAIRREKALGVSWRLEAVHAPLALAGRLVGVSGAVAEVAVLAVVHTLQNLPLRCAIAAGLIRDDDARDIRQPFQRLAEEFLGRSLASPALMGVPVPRFPAPIPPRLGRQDDAPLGHELFDIPIAEAGAEVGQDTVADDPGWRAMAFVEINSKSCGHAPSTPHQFRTGEVANLI
jgi:hypothetical protein